MDTERVTSRGRGSRWATRAAPGRLRDHVRLLRPRQWIKNGFVLAPLLFSGKFVVPSAIVHALTATVLFCVASAAAYVFNDLRDLEADRLHPVKRAHRPLAAGTVTPSAAWGMLAGLWGLVVASLLVVPWPVVAVAVGYITINILYSVRLKTVPVADLFVLAAGFVLRVYAGAAAIDVVLSSWMLTTTLCLALYLVATKRRAEILASGAVARPVLMGYTVALLSRYGDWAAGSAIAFYALFVMTVRPNLVLTVPLVLFGLFRYAYVVEASGEGESPTEVVWRDRPLMITVLAWAALCAILLRGAG